MLDAQKVFFQNIKAGVPISTVAEIANAVKGPGTSSPNSTNPEKLTQ
jgi:hypothetical protein